MNNFLFFFLKRAPEFVYTSGPQNLDPPLHTRHFFINPSGAFYGYTSCDILAVSAIHRLTPPPPPPTLFPLTSPSCCHTPFVSSFVVSNSGSVKSNSRVRAMILEDILQGRIDSTFYEVYDDRGGSKVANYTHQLFVASLLCFDVLFVSFYGLTQWKVDEEIKGSHYLCLWDSIGD